MPQVTLTYGHPHEGQFPADGAVVLAIWGSTALPAQYQRHPRRGHGWHSEGADYWHYDRQPWAWLELPAEWVTTCRLDWTR